MWIADVGRMHLRRRIVSTRREPRLGLRGPSGLLSPAVEGSCQETNFGSASLGARSISSSSGVRVREPLTGRARRHSAKGCAMAPFSVHHLAELRSWARPRLRARHQALRASCRRGSLHWDSSAVPTPHGQAGARRSALVAPMWPHQLALGLWFPGDGAVGGKKCARGMNDQGKTHPAGKARWVRTAGTARAMPVSPPIDSRRS